MTNDTGRHRDVEDNARNAISGLNDALDALKHELQVDLASLPWPQSEDMPWVKQEETISDAYSGALAEARHWYEKLNETMTDALARRHELIEFRASSPGEDSRF